MKREEFRKTNKDKPYDKLRLHSSERNSDFSERIFKKYINSITQDDIKFYPNLEGIYSILSGFYNTEHLIIGNGSDRCIEYFFQVNKNKELLISNPTFPMYNVYGSIYDCSIKMVDYDSLIFPIEEYIKSINKNTICVISNPSSPIGDIIERKDIIRILDTGVPVLVDEAYIDFSDEISVIDLIDDYSNLYVTRTLSKAFGSAGVRFGIITSQKENVHGMNDYRPMFEMNNLTIKWVETLLNNIIDVDNYIINVKKNKYEIVNRCKSLKYSVIDSNSNWIHVKGIENLPQDIILKTDCEIPNMGNNWLRLQITDNLEDYNWLK